MPLIFKYGAMGSGKSMHLLTLAYTCKEQGKSVVLIKPGLDQRNGKGIIWSRLPGLSVAADIVLNVSDTFCDHEVKQIVGADIVLVDEVQFLHPRQVEMLSHMSLQTKIICYGLRTDFRGLLFPATQMLFALADQIVEMKFTCRHCNQNAAFNHKKVVSEDIGVDLGADDKYESICKSCFYTKRAVELQKYDLHTQPLFTLS